MGSGQEVRRFSLASHFHQALLLRITWPCLGLKGGFTSRVDAHGHSSQAHPIPPWETRAREVLRAGPGGDLCPPDGAELVAEDSRGLCPHLPSERTRGPSWGQGSRGSKGPAPSFFGFVDPQPEANGDQAGGCWGCMHLGSRDDLGGGPYRRV